MLRKILFFFFIITILTKKPRKTKIEIKKNKKPKINTRELKMILSTMLPSE